ESAHSGTCRRCASVSLLMARTPSFGSMSFQPPPLIPSALQGPCYDQSLNLICPLVNLGNFGVAHHSLHRELPDVPIAAEHLHRLGSDPHGHIGAYALSHGTHAEEF